VKHRNQSSSVSRDCRPDAGAVDHLDDDHRNTTSTGTGTGTKAPVSHGPKGTSGSTTTAGEREQ